MQKFVVKKISRSTNVMIGAAEQTVAVDQEKPQAPEDLEISSVKMSGYLKKKRNRVGGWSKLYFVLQNNLLMSYNSKEEYDNQLVSFKDVICLIPGATVLLPSLEPRFTIASNLNTFYTFRCDDNKICSKWITAIVECLSRDDMDLDGSGNAGKKHSNQPRNFLSQQNLSHKSICTSTNHSWENLPKSNWMTGNHNGKILMELNYMNCNRAKLPIGAKTAKLLQHCTDSDVITTTKKINFIKNDENHNIIRHSELREEGDKNCDQFRLHNVEQSKTRQSRMVDQISKMFAPKSESQRLENLTHCNGNDSSEIGIEEQVQAMNFGDETGDYSSIQNYQSVDSKKFNNKLNIEETYAEIDDKGNLKNSSRKTEDAAVMNKSLPEYAVIDIQKKREGRRQKLLKGDNNESKDVVIYEDVGAETKANNEDNHIYELIDIPLRPSKKSRSLVWKNWSRMHIFDFTKRFKETSDDARKPPSPATISKRQKASLTLSDFSKRFNYQSMRKKARRMCTRNQSAFVSNGSSTETKSEKIASS